MMDDITTMTVDEIFQAFSELPSEKQELLKGKIDAVSVDVDWEPDEEQVGEILRRAAEVDAGAKTYSLDEVKAEMREILRARAG